MLGPAGEPTPPGALGTATMWTCGWRLLLHLMGCQLVMSRIAAPMLGGMVTAPLPSLLVVPALYAPMRRPQRQRS